MWQKADAPKNPFEAAASSHRPAKVPRIDEPLEVSQSLDSVIADESLMFDDVLNKTVVDVETIPDHDSVMDKMPEAVAGIASRLSCDSKKMMELSSSAHVDHGKQSSTSQNPLPIAMPYQPKDPKSFADRGKNSRRFQPYWFDHDDWKTWLHYDQEKDAAFCFTCIKAARENLLTKKNAEKTFISTGYRNWSDAATNGRGFDKHSRSESQRSPSTCSRDSSTVRRRW